MSQEKIGKVQLSKLKAGEVFKVGEHDFIVLEQMEGTTAVISKGFMAKDVIFDDDTMNYNESSLKILIERDIQPVIETAVGAENLVEHEADLISTHRSRRFGTCKCKIRPVTLKEASKYRYLLANEELTSLWWTCTHSEEVLGLVLVQPNGSCLFNAPYCRHEVRPFCILKSNIFVSKGK